MILSSKKTIIVITSLLFFCNCEKKSDQPETTPIIESNHAENVVELTDESLKNLELTIEPAVLGSLKRKLKIPGHLTSDFNRTAKVSSTMEGRITQLNQDIGDDVSTGSIMGLIETPELLDKPFTLKSPISGIVIERMGMIGELVEKGHEIYSISDPKHLWLIGEVKEQDISLVKLNQSVDFVVLSYPKENFHGKISRIASSIDNDTRTFEVRINVDNKEERLKHGMFADLEITTDILNNAILIEDAALQTEGEKQIVFVALTKNTFEKRYVKIGKEQDGKLQILEGIKEGEQIVLEGSFTLKSEMLKSELGEE